MMEPVQHTFLDDLPGFVWGILFWGIILGALVFLRPGAPIHRISASDRSMRAWIFALALLGGALFLAIAPMGLNPVWSGRVPSILNQYEQIARAFAEGHLDFGYSSDSRLFLLENPYDPEERARSGAFYYWDHAWYNGKYYMYFGVVPAVFLFLPYHLLTGGDLMPYHGTQVFAFFTIIGIFLLFRYLAKTFFPTLPASVYGVLAAAFSLMSLWMCIAMPALYCMALLAGICFEVWSLLFFLRAVYGDGSKGIYRWFFLGALCGALAFGCRPPVAMVNLLLIPLLITFLRRNPPDRGKILKLILSASPYIVIGGLLMIYNYARFQDPLEFGVSYQMTVEDQSGFMSFTERFSWSRLADGLYANFLEYEGITGMFPYLHWVGVFVTFPVMLLSFLLFLPRSIRSLREKGMLGWTAMLSLLPVIITAIDTSFSIHIVPRYRMDITFLMGILTFIAVGIHWENLKAPSPDPAGKGGDPGRTPVSERGRYRWAFALCALGILTVITCFLLNCVAYDSTLTEIYPQIRDNIARALFLER